MSTVAEVVTPERYKKGFTYPNYLSDTGQFAQQYKDAEKAFKLPPEDIDFYKKNARKLRTVKALALTEDHSPDAFRALPILKQIADVTGMEVRIFRRDQNLDIMDLYLNQGKFRSIPMFAFYDKDLRPLGHWIERPAGATKLIDAWREELAPRNLPVEEMRAELRKRREPYSEQWLKDTAAELRAVMTEVAKKIK